METEFVFHLPPLVSVIFLFFIFLFSIRVHICRIICIYMHVCIYVCVYFLVCIHMCMNESAIFFSPYISHVFCLFYFYSVCGQVGRQPLWLYLSINFLFIVNTQLYYLLYVKKEIVNKYLVLSCLDEYFKN